MDTQLRETLGWDVLLVGDFVYYGVWGYVYFFSFFASGVFEERKGGNGKL